MATSYVDFTKAHSNTRIVRVDNVPFQVPIVSYDRNRWNLIVTTSKKFTNVSQDPLSYVKSHPEDCVVAQAYPG